MRHNPVDIPDDIMVWDHYPEIARVWHLRHIDEDEWNRLGEKHMPDDDSDIDRMLRFVIFMVSQESPYYFESDYDVRIQRCMKAAGIRQNEPMGHMIVTRHWWYRRMLVNYLKAFAKRAFAQWISTRMMSYNLMEVMMRQPDAGDMDIKSFVKAQTDAQGELQSVMAEIDRLEQQLFPTSEIADMVATQTMFDSVNTAESYAEDFTTKTKFK